MIGTDSVLDLQAGDGDVAIRYATGRAAPTDGIAEQLLSDTFWPVCSPRLRLTRAAEETWPISKSTFWSTPIGRRPTAIRPPGRDGSRVARTQVAHVPEFKDMQHLSFREELHAIEAVIAGQGIGIFSDVLVAHELAAGTLVKAFDLSLPGYCFYVVRRPGHPREKTIRAFSAWLQSVR